MFDNFTEQARKAVDVARESAGQARRTSCGVEHLLLGLAASAESGAAAVLEGLGVVESAVRWRLSAPSEAVARPVSFSPAALGAIEQAKEAAARLGHDRVDTVHLLIGILAAGGEDALREVGVPPEELRVRIAELFGLQLPGARMHPDVHEWLVERLRAEAAQLHAELGGEVAARAIEMVGSSKGAAADAPARQLVRRAAALRHGGEVLRLDREIAAERDVQRRWEMLRRQANALPPAPVQLEADDLARAAKEFAT